MENREREMDIVRSVQMQLEVSDLAYESNGAYTSPDWQSIAESAPSIEQILYFVRQACPDFTVEVEEVMNEGERVLVRWKLQGTDTRGFQRRVPTGKQITMTGMRMVRHEREQHIFEWETSDLLTVLLQFGFICLPQQPRITVHRRILHNF